MHSEAGAFFDKHADRFGTQDGAPKGIGWSETLFLNFIKEKKKPDSKILDVGCGDGKFAERMSSNLEGVSVTAIDPSTELLDKISDPRITKIRGELPGNFVLDSKFDFIHLTDVLHHVTGSSIDSSRELVEESIRNLKSSLNDDGFLLVKDLFMESHFITSFTRSVVFHLLLLQNKVGIRVVPSSEFLLGLSVCFYTRSELKQIFSSCGLRIVDYREDFKKIGLRERLAFISNWGRMTFFLKKDGPAPV